MWRMAAAASTARKDVLLGKVAAEVVDFATPRRGFPGL
jgi:hypothetical protein